MCVCLDCEPVKCLSLASRPVGLGVLGPACAAPHGPFRDAGLVKDPHLLSIKPLVPLVPRMGSGESAFGQMSATLPLSCQHLK